MARDLKQGLVNRLRQVGAYDVGIADPNVGFEYAVEGKHPLDLWKQSRSVVVFAVACSSNTDHTYAGTFAPWKGNRNIGPVPQHIQSDDYGLNRLVRLFIDSITLKGMAFLQESGCNVSFSKLQLKLSAFEAGLGVYGRSGLIIHPVLGNRLRFGGILTDAVLEPDGGLEGFEPCENCDLCLKMCPAKAFDPTKRYPYSYSEEKCTSKLAKIADKGLYCDNCSAVCPPGKFKDEKLLCFKEAKSFFKRDRGEYVLKSSILDPY